MFCEWSPSPVPLGALDAHSRCVVCLRVEHVSRFKRKLTQGQRAILAAECWSMVGGAPNPRGGRPRKGTDGYPVTRPWMAAHWGISEAYLKWATAVVSDPVLTRRVKRGSMTLEEAYRQLRA